MVRTVSNYVAVCLSRAGNLRPLGLSFETYTPPGLGKRQCACSGGSVLSIN